ncbi:MAG: antibiotic biosynthesis monooxygenase [Candidatus Promineifilaceae bacterium]|nr:antibiotic biosynthesis monooxygenase [Candidatus Promineifilaceae bacterium]
MATLFAKHSVDAFGAWKRVYDEFQAKRREMGVQGASVHRDVEDENVVTVIHRFADTDAAAAFAESEELKAAMDEAGVVGRPEIWITEDVEQTAH